MKKWMTLVLLAVILCSCQKKEDEVLTIAREISDEPLIEETKVLPAQPEIEYLEGHAWINSPNGLRMREEPLLNEENTLTVIPQGEKVQLLLRQEDEVSIGGQTGSWYKVRWNGSSDTFYIGWVFGAYLSMEEPEDDSTLYYHGVNLNGFYMVNVESPMDGFLAIHGDQAWMLINYSQGVSIKEGQLTLQGDTLMVNINNYQIHLSIEINTEIRGFVLLDSYNAFGPIQGDRYMEERYSKAQTSIENTATGWLMLVDDPNGWGKWFGKKTIVVDNSANEPNF